MPSGEIQLLHDRAIDGVIAGIAMPFGMSPTTPLIRAQPAAIDEIRGEQRRIGRMPVDRVRDAGRSGPGLVVIEVDPVLAI